MNKQFMYTHRAHSTYDTYNTYNTNPGINPDALSIEEMQLIPQYTKKILFKRRFINDINFRYDNWDEDAAKYVAQTNPASAMSFIILLASTIADRKFIK